MSRGGTVRSTVLRRLGRVLRSGFARDPAYEYDEGLSYREAPGRDGTVLFAMPVSLCVNRAGAGFTDAVEHPIASTVVVLRRLGQRAAVRHLEAWYEAHVFGAWEEIFGLGPGPLSTPALSRMRHLPLESFRLPWETTGFISHKTPLYGPVERSYCRLEVRRIDRLVRSLERIGFEIRRQTNAIRGYLLRSGGEYRFIVKGGQHRVAALAVLGYGTVPVTWQEGWHRVVRAEDAAEWPHVRAGRIPETAARAVFETFFRDRAA